MRETCAVSVVAVAATACSLLIVAVAPAAPAAPAERAASECAGLEAARLCGFDGTVPEMQVRWDNKPRNVSFYWDSAPSRAASALLVVLLRHCIGYRGLHLLRMTKDYCELNYNDVAVSVWTVRRKRCGSIEGMPILDEGPRLGRVRLHVLLASTAPSDCAGGIRSWPFYREEFNLQNCSFLGTNSDTHAVLYTLCSDCKETVSKFKERARDVSLLVDVVDEPVERTQLMHMIRADNRSFLFLDYDIWQEYQRVHRVQPPPCTKSDLLCSDQDALDNTTGISFYQYKLQNYAPSLKNAFREFKIESKHLREILELEALHSDRPIEEVACSWARNNSAQFASLANHTVVSNRPIYKIITVSCKHDPDSDYKDFKKSTDVIFDELKLLTMKHGFLIDIDWFRIDCYNESHFSDLLVERSGRLSWYKVLGVVARGEGAAAVARRDRLMHLRLNEQLPMVLYDVAPARSGELRGPVWALAGAVPQLAAALRRLLADCGWRQLAVLCDRTYLSKSLTDELKQDIGLLIQPASHSPKETYETLKKLKTKNARIFLINAGPKEAAALLTAAFQLDMTPMNGYAWIVREWSGRSVDEMNFVYETKGAMRHYTISLWGRSSEDIHLRANETRRRTLVKALGEAKDVTWTLRAAPFIDAVLALGYGFTAFYRDHSKYRYDLHSEDAVRYFTKSLNENSIKGFSVEELQPTGNENQTAYVDEWIGHTRIRLAEWLVRDSIAYDVLGLRSGVCPPRDPPADTSGSCYTRIGDPFDPYCLDWIWISVLVLLPLLSVGLWALRVRQRKKDALRNEKLELARHGYNVTKLHSLVVNRDELEMREELGFGRSGRVNLAILRRAGHPRAVAAKALRDGAAPTEESDFLREACTLASLEHDHVVRLVGVCVIGGPTLVLMEHAFFGDLLRYLRTRRHLAEGVGHHPDGPDPEAEHVSAEALTRLAREAASALGYLALRGVVHCDVRAANCLVDARRSLKLGDFGMARQTQAARADAGLAEYACRRRAMFPVLWMAPESLLRGVFSAASDVWSLGVLVFELVTLGTRPYGDWSPLRVLHFVHDGGRPSLPLDASPQTRGLARACWQRAGEERPTAADVVAYLAERPRALSPALHLDPADPTLDPMDSDSGFGETPSPGPDAGAHEPIFNSSYRSRNRIDSLDSR